MTIPSYPIGSGSVNVSGSANVPGFNGWTWQNIFTTTGMKVLTQKETIEKEKVILIEDVSNERDITLENEER